MHSEDWTDSGYLQRHALDRGLYGDLHRMAAIPDRIVLELNAARNVAVACYPVSKLVFVPSSLLMGECLYIRSAGHNVEDFCFPLLPKRSTSRIPQRTPDTTR